MALILHNFIGFETGGLEEAVSTGGTPEIDTAFPRTGRYALKNHGASDTYFVDPFLEGTDQGDYYVLGFGFRIDNIGAQQNIFQAQDGAAGNLWILRITTGGYLEIYDNATSTFTSTTTVLSADTWYYIEIGWESTGTNDSMTIRLNGVTELVIATGDFNSGGTFTYYVFLAGASAAQWYDDFYCYSGASSGSTNMLGPKTRVIGAYANTLEDSTDQGTTLSNSTLWSSTSAIPFDTAAYAEYEGNSDQGHTRLDEGSMLGWLLDYHMSTLWKGTKFIWYNKYDGTKTPMYCRYGAYLGASDLMSNMSITPTKSWATYMTISELLIPSAATHYACIGADNGGTGNDVQMAVCVVTALVVPNVGGTITNYDPRSQNSYGGPFSV